MQKEPLNYIPRIAESLIESNIQSGKILILLGARQVGKTTLINRTLSDRSTCYINFDIEVDKQRFMAASNLDPSQVLDVFKNPGFMVVDEVQRLPEATRIIKGWYDSGLQVCFILCGSSSFQIADHAAESLAGRNRKIILPSLTYWEIVRNQPWCRGFSAGQVQNHFRDSLDTLLLRCLAYGHYPEAVVTQDRRSYLMNLTSDIMMRDLLKLGLVRTPDSIQKILMLLAHQIGSEVSINELASSSGISRTTIERYLSLLEQSFVIFKLPAFSSNPRKEITKSQKYYFWDTGIRNALLNVFSENPLRPDIGPLWENWVIAEFARQNLLSGQTCKLHFWRSRSGSEVDLIIQKDEKLRAYEIKWNPARKLGRAFTDSYKTEIHVIHRESPLFFMDEFLDRI